MSDKQNKWIVVNTYYRVATVRPVTFDSVVYPEHIHFDNYWEAYGLKLQIEQGLVDEEFRFKEKYRWQMRNVTG